ncbi:MAG: hypothetical protein ACP5XB_28575, partial [Isosphaeraceae bacterium]
MELVFKRIGVLNGTSQTEMWCSRGLAHTFPVAWTYLVVLTLVFSWSSISARAGDLLVDLGKAADASLVGAVNRWDDDGKPRFAVDPKAKIDHPRLDAIAVRAGEGRWLFRSLPAGHYDLIILRKTRVRVEGFRYPPINEFDPFLPGDAKVQDEETRDWIVKHIAKSQHYENKVAPLFLAGDDKQVRILVQLIRDKPTSYDAD